MSDSFEFTLHDPLTKEDWDKILDAEHENTRSVTFQTPQGRQVRYIKCEVLDKIRAEIADLVKRTYDAEFFGGKCPYTDKPCNDWECDTCEIEAQEKKDAEELDRAESEDEG